MDQPPLIKAAGLTKIFDRHKAVDDMSFEIQPGEVFGFLGPNGAGKTTTIRMLLNILTPSAGELTLFGTTFEKDRVGILRQMNASSGTLTLPGKMSVLENLKVFADMYGLHQAQKRVAHLLEKFDLGTLRDRSLYSLSTGQQVRVSLAKAFLNHPRLLLLDEPTASLDPDVADRVRTFLTDIVKEEKTTVFLTSHNMAEVEKVCTRVVFINEGKIQAEGSPKELAKRLKRVNIEIRLKKILQEIPTFGLRDIDIKLNQHDLHVQLDRDEVGTFITSLVKEGVELDNISTKEPTLEDFFVQSARAYKKDE